MSDRLRTDLARQLDGASETDRDAKIEQLLLIGLDHYFTAEYEQAINVWTRALFLDRSHARARAYIERARSAQAERQRESEELLHNGVAAFDRGESEEARRLLRQALNQGAHPDEALSVLDRLDRLEQRATPPPTPQAARGGRSTEQLLPELRRPSARVGLVLFAVAAVLVAAAAVIVLTATPIDWPTLLTLQSAQSTARAGQNATDQMPPVPRRGELALARARAFAAGGHLRDALAALDRIQQTDAQKPDADRLRADIQRQLIALSIPPAARQAAADVPNGQISQP
jgi:tetratricopeptide (TPR) repeat protein